MFSRCRQAFAVTCFYVTTCANGSLLLQSTVSPECFVLCEVRSVVIHFRALVEEKPCEEDAYGLEAGGCVI